MSYTQKGEQRNTGKTHFKKGDSSWNKGVKNTWTLGKKISKECSICFKRFSVIKSRNTTAKFCSKKCAGIHKMSGDKNPNWIGGSWLYVRKQILIDQDYTCQVCGLREPDIMEVNHKLERADYPELSHIKDNLEVLCPNCHRRKTNLFLKNKSIK